MTISNISAMPTAPTRTDPTNFSANADAWLAAFTNTTVPQLNAAINGINTAQSGADTDAATATSASTNAQAAATTAYASAKATAWVSGNTYQFNDCAISQVNFQTYRKKTTSSTNTGGATDPANDTGNWTVIGSTSMPKSARTSNTMLVATDSKSFIDLSGTFTQTFNTAANVGSGWFCFIRNNGTGYITLSPTSPSLIDGLSSISMMPGEVRVVQCDGSTFTTLLINTEGYFYAREEQTSNGAATILSANSGTRVLNTVKANTINATLSSNQVTLQPGTYRVKARSPFSQTMGARIALRNATDNVVLIGGSSTMQNNTTTYQQAESFVNGIFTLTASKAVDVYYYINTTGGTNNGGFPTNAGPNPEVFTELELWKIA